LSRENQDRYALASHIHDLLAPELAAEGWDLVDVRIFRGGGRLQVRLYVDAAGEGRIDLDGCAEASRSAGMFLEESALFSEPWVLEVSSPGIRRPLRTAAHFMAAIGSDVELKWRPANEPTSRPRNLRGRLCAVTDGMLVIEPAQPAAADSETTAPPAVSVPVGEVLEANLDAGFDVHAVIREDRRRHKEDKRARRAEKRGARRRRPQPPAPDAADERDGN